MRASRFELCVTEVLAAGISTCLPMQRGPKVFADPADSNGMNTQSDEDITPKLTITWSFSNPGRMSFNPEPVVLKCPAATNDMRFNAGIILTIGEALSSLESTLNDRSGKDGLSWRDFEWTPAKARAEIALFEELTAMGYDSPHHLHMIARHRTVKEGISFRRAAKEAIEEATRQMKRTPEQVEADETAAAARLEARGPIAD